MTTYTDTPTVSGDETLKQFRTTVAALQKVDTPYHLVIKRDLDSFMDNVNALILLGYTPVGPPQVTELGSGPAGSNIYYVQSMYCDGKITPLRDTLGMIEVPATREGYRRFKLP